MTTTKVLHPAIVKKLVAEATAPKTADPCGPHHRVAFRAPEVCNEQFERSERLPLETCALPKGHPGAHDGYRPRPLVATLRPVRSVGGCNFCHRNVLNVFEVRSEGPGGGLRVRFCNACLKSLQEQTK